MARASRVGSGKHKHRRRLCILLGVALVFTAIVLLAYARRLQVSSSSSPHRQIRLSLPTCTIEGVRVQAERKDYRSQQPQRRAAAAVQRERDRRRCGALATKCIGGGRHNTVSSGIRRNGHRRASSRARRLCCAATLGLILTSMPQ
jgi:hypothetical protein